ncbi:MAG: DUF3817 domain-containing protein [Bacteroidia bacterium]|nr:DUF3817 domain-containing protein [Bacteroidia bacterium]
MELTEEQKQQRIKRFLNIGKIEGYSYLILLFIAMPLKYAFKIPEAVRIVGLLHGVLFVAFMYQILQMMIDKQFNFIKAVKAFLLSIIPFGTFFLKKLL